LKILKVVLLIKTRRDKIMTVRELNLKIDALDECSALLYDMCDESKPLKYPLGNDHKSIILLKKEVM